MSDVNWQRVRQGEAQMIMGGQRPILALTFSNVRDAAGDDSLSDEFCAEVLNRYKDEQDLPWIADVAALVKNEQEERGRGEDEHYRAEQDRPRNSGADTRET